jgi:hypothetical protein
VECLVWATFSAALSGATESINFQGTANVFMFKLVKTFGRSDGVIVISAAVNIIVQMMSNANLN